MNTRTPSITINTLVRTDREVQILAELGDMPSRGAILDASERFADGNYSRAGQEIVYDSVAFTKPTYLGRH